MATAQETLQITSIVPNFTVDDLQKSITFYEGLGFAVDERWEEEGTLLGVMLRAGKNRIGLSQDDWKKGRDRKKGVGMRVFIATTQNVDRSRPARNVPASSSAPSRTIPSGRVVHSRSLTRAGFC